MSAHKQSNPPLPPILLACRIRAERPELAGMDTDTVISKFIDGELLSDYWKTWAYQEVMSKPLRAGAEPPPAPPAMSKLFEEALLLTATEPAAHYIKSYYQLQWQNQQLTQRVAELEAARATDQPMNTLALDLADMASNIILGQQANNDVNSNIRIN